MMSLIPEPKRNKTRARARDGALGELQSLMEFAADIPDWKAEGTLMQAYREQAEDMMLALDTLRRKVHSIGGFEYGDLHRWIMLGISFDHFDKAKQFAEMKHMTPRDLLEGCIGAREDGGNLTVDEMIAFALSEKPLPHTALPSFVMSILSRLDNLPHKLGWDDAKIARWNSRLNELRREFFNALV